MENALWTSLGFVAGVFATLVVISTLRHARTKPVRTDDGTTAPWAVRTDDRKAAPWADRADDGEIAELRQNLRLKLMYDEARIDRLIDAERERCPQASLAQLMRTAIGRWERDNR